MSFLKKMVSRAMHRQLSKLDGLYQRHAGEECYIFGSGVTLKWMDLHQFTDRHAILGNQFIYHKEAKALKASYCANIEPYFFYPYFPHMGLKHLDLRRHTVHEEYRKTILQFPETLFLLNLSNYPVTRFPNVIYVTRQYKPPFKNKNPFQDRNDSFTGSLTFQIALAIYLGFKKAYLVGHDYTHFPTRGGHFFEKGEGVHRVESKRVEGGWFFPEYLHYAKTQIDLVTVVLDGEGEALSHITYKDLTGKEPTFRENIEIVDRVKLESLVSFYGGYPIL